MTGLIYNEETMQMSLCDEGTTGSRAMMFDVIARDIETFGINVKLISDNSTYGDLGSIANSAIEVIDDNHDPMIPIFTLCHLFGHLIQFALSSKYSRLTDQISAAPPVALSEVFWSEFYQFEEEAFRYGASLLTASGSNQEAMKRYSAFFAADFAHFRTYMATGYRTSRAEYRRELQMRLQSGEYIEPIRPLDIPLIDVRKLANVEVTIF